MTTAYLDEYAATKDPGPEHHELKDEEILQASLREPALFQVLVERYQEPLYRAAWRVVQSREEAEDIVQEAFVKMYKNADRFHKLSGIEFKSWAYKVAINTAITHYRKLKRAPMLAEDPTVFDTSEPDDAETRIALAADAKAAVSAALEDLPDNLQTVLKSYYFDDKSYKTIAEEEGISIPALKMRLFRAKRLFRKITKDNNLL